jgi:hypothetical protein
MLSLFSLRNVPDAVLACLSRPEYTEVAGDQHLHVFLPTQRLLQPQLLQAAALFSAGEIGDGGRNKRGRAPGCAARSEKPRDGVEFGVASHPAASTRRPCVLQAPRGSMIAENRPVTPMTRNSR